MRADLVLVDKSNWAEEFSDSSAALPEVNVLTVPQFQRGVQFNDMRNKVAKMRSARP